MKIDELNLTPRRKNYLLEMGFNSVEDIALYLPNKYINLESKIPDSSYENSTIVVEGNIVSEVETTRIRENLTRSTFYIEVDYYELYRVVIFNRDYLNNSLVENRTIKVMGKLNYFKKEIVASNIYFDLEKDILPTYTLKRGMNDTEFSKIVGNTFKYLKGANLNVLPSYFIDKYNLKNKQQCLKLAHFPTRLRDIKDAYRHLKYEELLEFALAMEINREIFKKTNKSKKKVDFNFMNDFILSLPYKLTESQSKAVMEILADLNNSSNMYRILQGDVGSGKTLVAFISMIAIFNKKAQSCFMAPTDLLARQHYQNILEITSSLDIKVELLVGSMTNKEKTEIKERLKNGEIDILIGTHSLIQDDVNFKDLELVIIDEQHRFGVEQRIKLKEKGENVDLLLMSATPIPRTLAQTIYGDLSISSLEGFPSGRREVETTLIKDEEEIFDIVSNNLQEDKKIFIICPLIEDEDKVSVLNIYKEYKKRYGEYGVLYIHGRLSAEEKISALEKFARGEVKILVSTTVIEVGIDIKDATEMIIYGSNNFGMAQLHQLRGRIGRNGESANCYLLSDTEDIDTLKRLEFFASIDDGYKISEFDMKRRGIGDLVGLKQSGVSTDFKYASVFNDYIILSIAREDAKYVLNNLDDEELYKYYLGVENKTKQNIGILN